MPSRAARPGALLLAAVWTAAACGSAGDAPRTAAVVRSAGTPTTAAATGAAATPSPSPTAFPVPTLPAQELARTSSCGRRLAERMDLREQVGQLLVVGVPATDPGEGEAVVRRYRLGGVFLRGRTSLTPQRLRDRLKSLQRNATRHGGVQLHIAVDQEGGKVRNLRGRGFSQLPAAVEQSRWEQSELAARAGELAGQLRDAGVTINLGPVADTVPTEIGADNPPIGALGRQFGATPKEVAEAVRIVVGATQQESVLATLKHFPGLGRVTENTDYSAEAVDTRTTATDPTLEPFRAGIDAGAAFVMVSSASYPQLDADSVAAFSHRVVTDLLRQGLHFDGVVISDDLGSAVAMRAVAPGDRAVRFVRAGGDLVLTIRLSDAQPMATALTAEAERDRGFRSAVQAAAARVLTSKARTGLVSCTG